jgi:prolyl-tRNA synthetase
MGGSASEEFLAPTRAGEDTFVRCEGCDYAANTEAVEIAGPAAQDPTRHAPSVVLDTPDTPTIESLVIRMNQLGYPVSAAATLRDVVLKTRAPGSPTWQLLIVGVPGDPDVDLKRLCGQLEPTEIAAADVTDLAAQPVLVKGYIGPQILGGRGGVRYLVDPLVAPGTAWITGANERGRHAANVVRGRDFIPDGEIGAVEIRDGDLCARCGGALRIDRGIELGHVFQLGRKYAEVFGLTALGPHGKSVTVTMGSYGIGITRAVAALAEQTLDHKGLCWPEPVAPADVHLLATGRGDEFEAAESLAVDLDARGIRVLFDDRRSVSAGVKFTDAELLDVPIIVVIGRDLARGLIELRDRRSGRHRDVPLASAASAIEATVARTIPSP